MPLMWELMGTHSNFSLLPLSLFGSSYPHLPEQRLNCKSVGLTFICVFRPMNF